MKYSVIIVAYKAMDLLGKCCDSVFSTLEDEGEIIVVDNTPGARSTEEMLMIQPDQYYHDGTNHGFSEGCNIGARMAKGEILIFLNPDTEVYGDWADRMAKHLADPNVGAVGPISNFVAGLQNARYHLEPKDTSVPVATKMLIGFCLMMRREVWDEMGGLDPKLFLGCDDLDLSWRLQLAGYTLLIAPDVFVHHAGHKSFETEPGPQVKKWLRESEQALRDKLQAYYEENPPSAVELWGVDMMNTAAVKPMTLSVCMIVREEGPNLESLLPQLEFADEVVIVDTKPDRPPEHQGLMRGHIISWVQEKAPALAHRVVRVGLFPWVDDFAAARNYALSLCTGDWVLWLDADDRVPEKAAKLIRVNLDRPGPQTHNRKCYFTFLVEDMGQDGRPAHRFSQPRLFPRLPGMEWVGRLHESIVPAAEKLELACVDTDITIQHTGYADPSKLTAKAERNLRILAGDPDSSAKRYNMGQALGMVGRWEEALAEYRLALDTAWLEPLTDGFRAQVAYSAVRALHNLGRLEDMAPLLEGLGHPDAHFMAGRLWEARSDRLQAIAAYRQFLDFTGKPVFWPWETDTPVFRPVAYASMIRLMEEEFYARQEAFKAEYPHCFEGAPG